MQEYKVLCIRFKHVVISTRRYERFWRRTTCSSIEADETITEITLVAI